MARNLGHARADDKANETKHMSRNTLNYRDFIMYLSMLSPRPRWWWGGRATHGVLTVRSVPRVWILIVQDIPRVENLT